MKKHVFQFFLIAIALLTASVQAGKVSINVSDDMGGYYRPGDWFPVILSISNQPGGDGDDKPFEGRAILSTTSYSSDHGAYQFVRDLSVPVSSTQRYILYAKIPSSTSKQYNIEIRRANGQFERSIPLDVNLLSSSDILSLTVSQEATSLSLPTNRLYPGVNAIKQSIRSPQFLPETWAGYDTADMIVLPAWYGSQMTTKRIEALKDWVRMGGTLIMLGGSGTSSYEENGADEFLPVAINGSSSYAINTSLSRLEKVEDVRAQETGSTVILTESELLPGSELLLEGSGGLGKELPLAVRRELGEGQIVFFAFDFRANNREVHDIISPTWFSILPMKNKVAWEEQFVSHVENNMILVTGAAARPPSAVIIILICILYTLVVGPLNFFILSKMQRIQLAWLTVPVIVFFFSGMIYLFGSLTKGGTTIARETTLMFGRENQPGYEVQSFMGVLTPKEISLRLDPKNDHWTLSDHDRWRERASIFGFRTSQIADAASGIFGDIQGNNPIIESMDDSINVERWELPPFGLKRFEIRGMDRDSGPIRSTIEYHSNQQPSARVWFEGEISNDSGMDFYDSALIFSGSGIPLGGMQDGESIQITDSMSSWIINRESSPNHPWEDLMENIFEVASAEFDETNSGISRQNALFALDGIFNPEDTGVILPSMKGKLYFVGLSESDDFTGNMNLVPDEGNRSIVTLVELNPIPADRNFFVPPKFVNVKVQNEIPMNNTRGGDLYLDSHSGEQILEMRNMETIFSLELPFQTPGLVVDQITEHIDKSIEQNNQTFSVVLQPLKSRNQGTFNNSVARNNSDQYLTPYSGQGWIIIRSDAPRDEKGEPIDKYSTGSQSTRIKSIEFGITGRVEP